MYYKGWQVEKDYRGWVATNEQFGYTHSGERHWGLLIDEDKDNLLQTIDREIHAKDLDEVETLSNEELNNKIQAIAVLIYMAYPKDEMDMTDDELVAKQDDKEYQRLRQYRNELSNELLTRLSRVEWTNI